MKKTVGGHYRFSTSQKHAGDDVFMYQIKPLYIIIFRLKKNVSGLGLMNSSFCVNCT